MVFQKSGEKIKHMRSYIFDFEQKKLVENKLNMQQVLLLDYLSNFFSSGFAKVFYFEGKNYYWMTYNKILTDLPILNLKERQLRNLIGDLIKKGLIYKINPSSRKMFLRLEITSLYY